MSRFIYYNANPNGENIDDCVTRAISLGGNIPYYTVSKMLYHTGELLNCDKLCKCCYSFLLDNVLKYREIPCDELTVGEFADLHPYGVYIVRIEGHLTVIIDGDNYDTWDTRGEICDTVWRVK